MARYAARSYLMSIDGFCRKSRQSLPSGGMASLPALVTLVTGVSALTRAVAPACLECHATGVQAIAGTQNGYQSPPFLEGRWVITLSRSHQSQQRCQCQASRNRRQLVGFWQQPGQRLRTKHPPVNCVERVETMARVLSVWRRIADTR